MKDEFYDDGARISFRWSENSLEVVKQASRIVGIPLSAFLKTAAYREAKMILQNPEFFEAQRKKDLVNET